MGKEIGGKRPTTLITDGAANFQNAYLNEFYTSEKLARTRHIQEIQLAGCVHNNKMEPTNGEIRDHGKVTRTFKKMDTPILTGVQISHNYIRPHMALDGKTPSEVA